MASPGARPSAVTSSTSSASSSARRRSRGSEYSDDSPTTQCRLNRLARRRAPSSLPGNSAYTRLPTACETPSPRSSVIVASSSPGAFSPGSAHNATAPALRSAPIRRARRRTSSGSRSVRVRSSSISDPLSACSVSPLQFDVGREHLLPERLLDPLGAGHLLDRRSQHLRQVVHTQREPLLLREVVEVAFDRFGQLVPLLDPLEARLQQRREGEVRV